jgi:hypothetical protein
MVFGLNPRDQMLAFLENAVSPIASFTSSAILSASTEEGTPLATEDPFPPTSIGEMDVTVHAPIHFDISAFIGLSSTASAEVKIDTRILYRRNREARRAKVGLLK